MAVHKRDPNKDIAPYRPKSHFTMAIFGEGFTDENYIYYDKVFLKENSTFFSHMDSKYIFDQPFLDKIVSGDPKDIELLAIMIDAVEKVRKMIKGTKGFDYDLLVEYDKKSIEFIANYNKCLEELSPIAKLLYLNWVNHSESDKATKIKIKNDNSSRSSSKSSSSSTSY